MEHLGVTTNFLFGAYDYHTNFGFMIGETPVTIGFAWLLVIGCSHEMARGMTKGMKGITKWVSFIAAGSLVTVTMDLILDPVSYIIKHYWEWENEGVYYGIPLSNFIGWFLLASLFHTTGSLLLSKHACNSSWERRMGLTFGLINGMFILIAITGELFWAAILTAGLSVMWYFIYHWRVKKYA
ncbi:carotenoid biosynthesis protein [Halobacillus salinarum]|uniref:Carotenoid biosynthesis protein n=1 Tax=Halobacillus salinarum TaxID=2932257 RepID=A0ABY4ERG8_9BACI|nr:carotenoid biosynthesis protein [Halobacillus salinarum]UOQ46497.1 carotenoid biosynthesis protein [Halobacillus salinarum]